MTERSPESMLHELDYWKCVIVDVRELNYLAFDASAQIARTALALAINGDVEAAVIRLDRTMAALENMDEPINRILSLIEGRQTALQTEGARSETGERWPA